MKARQIRKILCSTLIILWFAGLLAANSQIFSRVQVITRSDADVQLGAERMDVYLPLLRGKSIAVVANHTSLIGKTHLVDTLQSRGVKIKQVFAPEHGFRGAGDAGEKIASGKDPQTGLPVVSLYGDNKKPTAAQLTGVDLVLFDIQDVGARFYTYISTLSYVMEACAEQKIPVVVLDRPNPNGHYFDGPVLDPKFSSFVGMHPVPVVHGMTVGEYAQMVNGEGWLKGGIRCSLQVIPCVGWKHSEYYQITTPPSPNLKTMNAIYLYPSLCFFEGTPVSVGRGTATPFEVFGMPGSKVGTYTFTPKSGPGSKQPLHQDKVCTGFNLQEFGKDFVRDSKRVYLYWLMSMYEQSANKEQFFNNFFDKLAGTDSLRKMIQAGKSEEEIRASWQPGLLRYAEVRKKYLIYEE